MNTQRSRLLLLSLSLLWIGCQTAEDPNLTVYSGRSKSLVDPVVEKFSADTGIKVDVRYGDTAEMAVALMEEGDQSRADVFWAQDAGALGAVAEEGLLAPLPDSLRQKVGSKYVGNLGTWVATSGRARTLAYSVDRVSPDQLPSSVFDLTAAEYRGRVGWAPANGSFQAFVTAMRIVHGDDQTRTWLTDMKANGAVAFPKNTAILQGIANGDVDFGLPNHYYLFRFKSEDPNFPVEQTSFEAGDIGNLVNVAGVGIVTHTDSPVAAARFVSYVLGNYSQEYFAEETFEYPVVQVSSEGSLPPDSLVPAVELDQLQDLQQTLDMLREIGLL
ncbi:MAG: iron ABC transporter substrate-binding protein [Rhodothermia bacterium]|nr:iron ABC transporter substrate-binding protein [Rhodothermia bacterium]